MTTPYSIVVVPLTQSLDVEVRVEALDDRTWSAKIVRAWEDGKPSEPSLDGVEPFELLSRITQIMSEGERNG